MSITTFISQAITETYNIFSDATDTVNAAVAMIASNNIDNSTAGQVAQLILSKANSKRLTALAQ